MHLQHYRQEIWVYREGSHTTMILDILQNLILVTMDLKSLQRIIDLDFFRQLD